MKKLGTPIGAGPGSEREKVGLLVPGTPLPEGSATLFFLAFLAGAVGAVLGCEWVDGFCCLAGLVGSGVGTVVDFEVEVELEVVVVLELAEEEVELDPGLEVTVVLVLVELVEVGAQVSVSETRIPVIGRLRLAIGVPGGTLTLKVYVLPPTTVTVIVQASAEAVGSAAADRAMSAPTVIASTYSSFRLLLKVSDSSR
jgi:hypothetical protein